MTHFYERFLIVFVALLPIFAIAYIYLFQNPFLLFINHGFHEFAICVAILQTCFISYVTWRCYVSSGEPLLRWLTLSFIGFTVVYGLHGVFTQYSDDHIMLFLLYGPASRFVMAVCLLAGLFTYGNPPHLLRERVWTGFCLRWTLCFLALDILVGWIALSLPVSKLTIRIGLEWGALLLILSGIAYIFLRRISSWMLVVYTISLSYLALSSLAFILAKPWNHLWWLAHLISAGGITILSYGVIRAFHTTKAFSLVFSQEEILKQLADAKADSEKYGLYLKNILDNLPAYIALLDSKGVVQEVNNKPLERAGMLPDDVIGEHFYDIASWTHDEKVRLQLIGAIEAAGQGHANRYDVTVKMGEDLVPVDFQIIPVTDENGQTVSLLTIGVDITERKKDESELRIAAAVFESQEGMMVTDANMVILRVNPAFTEITGYTAEEAIGQTPILFKSGRQDMAFYHAMWESIEHTRSWQGEIWNRRKNGEVYPEKLTITAVKSEAGKETTHYVATLHDITLRKQIEEQLQKLSSTDPLTGLFNRRIFLERLEQEIVKVARLPNYSAVLLMLDLDFFKLINDTYGHAAGDAVLKAFAEIVRDNSRAIDVPARLGGEEFAILLTGTDKNNARVMAERMREKVAEIVIVHELGLVKVTVSIGAACFLADDINGEAVMNRADAALYESKKRGRNQTCWFGF